MITGQNKTAAPAGTFIHNNPGLALDSVENNAAGVYRIQCN